MNATAQWYDSEKQVALVKKTVAKDCDRDSQGRDLHLGEFDWFCSICKKLNLDPLRRQIYAFVFNKDDPSKRQLVFVIGIGGYRAIAARTGDYRPGSSEIVIDERLKDPATNPIGISHAKVSVFRHSHGEWHEFSDVAYWEEFAPLKEIWVDNKRTGKFQLDPKKDGWRKMGRLMIEKCAEAKTLRRGWPENLSGTYGEEELDRHKTIELTATEMAASAEQAERLAKLGGPNQIAVQWEPNKPLERVQAGKFHDAVMEFIGKHKDQPSVVMIWRNMNTIALQDYWAHDKDAALSLKVELEKVNASIVNVSEAAE
jgi:phage recombination protein Bet